MPSDQAVATVNNTPKRIGITRVMGPIRSLLEAHARENYTELIPIARGSEELVDEHRDSGIGIHLQPVGGNRLFKMLYAWRGVADFVQEPAIHKKLDFERPGGFEAVVPNGEVGIEGEVF